MNLDCYIINLESRIDRKSHMMSEILKLECQSYEFINAIQDTSPMIGCNLSHQHCIQLAKDRGLEYVLILEDDCIFEPNVNTIFKKSWESVQEFEWNLLYLGGNIKGGAKYINENLLAVKRVNTTHAYAIHNRFYDTVLNLSTDIIIDYQYRDLSNKYPMYMCAPMIAFQRQDYSDIQHKNVNYKQSMIDNFIFHTTKK